MFDIYFKVTGCQTLKSRQKLKQKHEAQTMADASFLKQPRTTCLGNGAAHSGLGPPALINILHTAPIDLHTGHFDVDNPSMETLFPDDTRLCLVDSQS